MADKRASAVAAYFARCPSDVAMVKRLESKALLVRSRAVACIVASVDAAAPRFEKVCRASVKAVPAAVAALRVAGHISEFSNVHSYRCKLCLAVVQVGNLIAWLRNHPCKGEANLVHPGGIGLRPQNLVPQVTRGRIIHDCLLVAAWQRTTCASWPLPAAAGLPGSAARPALPGCGA